MAPSNQAAILPAKAVPLKLQQAEYTPAGDKEIVVKNVAVAINPYDSIIQSAANLVVAWVKLPFILGTDVAGDVVEVGKEVTRFKVGDRVVGFAVALDKRVNRACEGGFQQYTILRQDLTSSIPEFISYESACVLPLALSTAASGLFLKDFLALPHPVTSPKPMGKTLIVWGGSTSVGCNAIQLARAAGCEVITTASPKNHAYLRKLGAAEVYDYNSRHAVRDIQAAMKTRIAAGAIAIGRGSLNKCIDILGGCKGNKFVAYATLDMPPFPKRPWEFPGFLAGYMSSMVSSSIRSTAKGVQIKMINGTDLLENGVDKAVYQDFLPQALDQGRFVPAPEPQVVGKGLEHVQDAMDVVIKGVSAKKLVVLL